MVATTAPAQLIDTVEDAYVTANDSVNRSIGVKKGFRVHILQPELLTGKGAPVKNGFRTYYIHVVKAQVALIDSFPLTANDSQVTYFAIAAATPRIQLQGDTLSSRALFLKGIVLGEDADAEARAAEFDTLAMAYDRTADSLAAALDSIFMPEPWIVQRQSNLERMAYNCRITAEAYRAFRGRGKRGTDVARFFLQHYLNQSDQFNIYTHPFGLPEVTDAAAVDAKGNPLNQAPAPGAAPPRKRKKGLFGLFGG